MDEVVAAPVSLEGITEEEETAATEGGASEAPSSLVGSQGEVGSEDATGVATLEGDEQLTDQLSDMSDTGWDTDLEIEEDKEEYDSTGGSTYLKSCEALGIIPASYFVRGIQSKQTAIHMTHHGVGHKGAKAIAVALTYNTAVTHLDLSDNGIETEGCVAIAAMMKENCYITHLDLSDNDMGPPAAFALVHLYQANSTLVHLGLRGNGFSEQAAEPLSEIIRGSYHIQHLDLSHNEFGEKAGEILGPALAESEALRYLDLSWNHIRRKGGLAVANGLKSNQTLKTLNLAYNGLANEGAVAIADALKLNSTLEELDISNNRICLDGAVVISKVLPVNDSLKVLKIGKNAIQPEGVQAFITALQACSTCSLQYLDFDGITVNLQLEKALKELLETHSSLQVTHGGTGGYKAPKPLPGPVEKLAKYCKENSVVLMDLFRTFDKEKHNHLSEEEFRNALKHISAPLMEFERQKLVKSYRKDEPSSSDGDGVATEGDPASPAVIIDYHALVNAAKALDGEKKIIQS